MAVPPRIRLLVCVLTLALPALAACTSTTATVEQSPAVSSASLSAPAPAPTSTSTSTPLTSTSSSQPSSLLRAAPKVDPQHPYDHVVVVVMENHASGQILGSAQAPYLNALAKRGLVLSDSHGETHPSEPNYLALFAGQTFGVTSDACPLRLTGPTLAGELRAAHLGFAGYSEGLPKTGFTGCQSGRYARKHNPWVNFASLPASLNKSFSAFPKSYGSLPTVSIVVPDLGDDMHDGTIQQADSWLRKKLGAYVTWASSHRSLLIVTWDEDNGTSANHIPTFVVGDQVRVGTVARRVNHYTLLRTIEDLYGLPRLGQSRQEKPIALTG